MSTATARSEPRWEAATRRRVAELEPEVAMGAAVRALVLAAVLAVAGGSAVHGQLPTRVADLARGTVEVGSNPHDFQAVGGVVVFSAREAAAPGGDRLWASDGTAAGTVRLSDDVAVAGPAGRLGETLLWLGQTPGGPSLWATGGTRASTIRLSPPGLRVDPLAIGTSGRTAFFLGTSASGGLSLWTTDGSAGASAPSWR